MQNFGDMPQEAAGEYGDRKFTAMMMAKVMCVQMVSALEYNILFQVRNAREVMRINPFSQCVSFSASYFFLGLCRMSTLYTTNLQFHFLRIRILHYKNSI
jgi:hypothetical protein